MRIVFFLGRSFDVWTPETIKQKGSPGSEWMAAELAKGLVKRGHEVTMYSECGARAVYDGVTYVPQSEFGAGPESDVLVAYRTPSVVDQSCLNRTKRIVFVATDKHYSHDFNEERARLAEKFVVVSEFHKRIFMQHHPLVKEEKLVVIPNGVDTSLFKRSWLPPRMRRFGVVYTSSPDRGLDTAISIMPAVRRKFSAAELHVCHSFFWAESLAKQTNDRAFMERLRGTKLLIDAYKQHGVVWHEHLSRPELYELLCESRVWLYPCTVEETGCIAAMEAQIAGCRIVTNRLGALPETVKKSGAETFVDDGDYLSATLAALAASEDEVSTETRCERFVQEFDIERVVDRYEEVFVPKEEIVVHTNEELARLEQTQAVVPADVSAQVDGVVAAQERARLMMQQTEGHALDYPTLVGIAEACRDGLLLSDAARYYAWAAGGAPDSVSKASSLFERAKLLEKLTSDPKEVERAYDEAAEASPAFDGPAVAAIGRYRESLVHPAQGPFPRRSDQRSLAFVEIEERGDELRTNVHAEGGSWTIVMPKQLSASHEPFRLALTEGLLRTAGKSGVPASGEIWLGVHEPAFGAPPGDAIIYQTEVASSPWFTGEYLEKLMRAREVWDYSTDNMLAYGAKQKRHVPLWYAESLVPAFSGHVVRDVDMGLCGSPNFRRQAIIDDGVQNRLNLSPLERDQWHSRIKVHVIPHFYENAPVEQARISQLLAAGYCVVAEHAPDERAYPGPMYVPYTELVPTAQKLIDKGLWLLLGLGMREVYKQRTMADALVQAFASDTRVEAMTQDLKPPSEVLLEPQSDLTAFRPETEVIPPEPPRRLNLGCSDAHVPGHLNVDRVPPADIVADLTKAWPWADSSVEEIRAHDIIEHLPDKIFTMNEAWRVLKPGGRFEIVVPTTEGRGAWQDPTHVSYWNRNSFFYFTDGDAHRERFGDAYGIQARFRVLSEETRASGDNVVHLCITLEAVKPQALSASAAEVADNLPFPWYGEHDLAKGGKAKFVALMRVKNEGASIQRALASIPRTFFSSVHVFDDHSTDNTAELARRAGAHVYASPFEGFDEARDKDWLLQKVMVDYGASADSNVWCVMIDGDEELEPGALEKLLAQVDPTEHAYNPRIRYLWNTPNQIRVDGVYGRFRRPSIFRLISPELRFRSGEQWGKGNLHCGSVPAPIIDFAKDIDLDILHYGYMEREERVKKFIHYNTVDPGNEREDYYRHMIVGDGPVEIPTHLHQYSSALSRGVFGVAGGVDGERHSISVPLGAQLKWGGPLTLQGYDRTEQR